MKKLLLIWLIAAGISHPAFAAVEPYTVFLSIDNSFGPTQYIAPNGKVLIVTHFFGSVSGTKPTSTDIRVIIYADNIAEGSSFANVRIREDFLNGVMVPLDKNFILNAGDRLAIPSAPSGGTYRLARYKGLLLDAEDLYAKNIPTEQNNTEISGDKLLAGISYGSPRPRTTRIQSSTDLLAADNGFSSDATGIETPGATRDAATVSIDTGADDVKFLRVAATARLKEFQATDK